MSSKFSEHLVESGTVLLFILFLVCLFVCFLSEEWNFFIRKVMLGNIKYLYTDSIMQKP